MLIGLHFAEREYYLRMAREKMSNVLLGIQNASFRYGAENERLETVVEISDLVLSKVGDVAGLVSDPEEQGAVMKAMLKLQIEILGLAEKK